MLARVVPYRKRLRQWLLIRTPARSDAGRSRWCRHLIYRPARFRATACAPGVRSPASAIRRSFPRPEVAHDNAAVACEAPAPAIAP